MLDALQKKCPRDAVGREDGVGVATKAVAPEVSHLLMSLEALLLGAAYTELCIQPI